MIYDGVRVERLGHASFKLVGEKIVYFDPFRIEAGEKADVVFITHSHYDHCSVEDVKKIVSRESLIICTPDCMSKLNGLEVKGITTVEPGQVLKVLGLEVEVVPAYNLVGERLQFHSSDNDWVGFVVGMNGKRFYHMGDTDNVPELRKVSNVDVLMIPVSGTYVMAPEEAAEAAKVIGPKVAVPMHYGAIVGTVEDAKRFAELYGGDVRII